MIQVEQEELVSRNYILRSNISFLLSWNYFILHYTEEKKNGERKKIRTNTNTRTHRFSLHNGWRRCNRQRYDTARKWRRVSNYQGDCRWSGAVSTEFSFESPTEMSVIFYFDFFFISYILFCSMTNKCTIIWHICEIIVHLLVIVQNKKRCTVHVFK